MASRRFHVFEAEQVQWAGLLSRPPHFGLKKNYPSAAQKLGIRYENKAQAYLEELYPDSYVRSPWIAFRLRGEPMLRYCQPDGLVVDLLDQRVTIIEIKLRHMQEAYTQITGIYHPVLQYLFPQWKFRHVEVTRYYDPVVYFPVPVQLLSNIDLAPHGRFGVHIWR